MLARATILTLMLIGGARTVAAQRPADAPPQRPGPYVIDVRGTTAGAPQSAQFFPSVPSGTIVPSRAFGLDVGGHVYLFQLGAGRLGVGGDLFRLRGTASPPKPTTSTSGTTSPTTPAAQTTPDMTVRVTTFAPQISWNFGSSTGWSYLSAGLGRAQVTTERSAFDMGTAQRRRSGSVTSQNFGGGARWFTSDHLAFTFDIRFHLLSPGAGQPIPGSDALTPGTPRIRIVTASAGMSFR